MDIDELFRSSEHKPPRPPGAGTPARAPGAMADAALLSVDDLFTPIARPALRPNAGGAGGSGAGGSGAAGGGHKRSFDPVEESDLLGQQGDHAAPPLALRPSEHHRT